MGNANGVVVESWMHDSIHQSLNSGAYKYYTHAHGFSIEL